MFDFAAKKLPGPVTEVVEQRIPESYNFTLIWQPPSNMGGYTEVAVYCLTWGLETSRVGGIPIVPSKDGFLNVSGVGTLAFTLKWNAYQNQ